MAVLPSMETFATSLRIDEFLLRGGYLDEPRLFTNIQTKDKRPFIPLCTKNRNLRMFFSGQSTKCSVLLHRLSEFIAELRDEHTDRWSKPAASPESDQAVKALGCDNSEAHRPRAFETARKKARIKKALVMQRPIITVPFHFGSELVDIQVLTVRTKNATPAVEASAANFRAMFCWCRLEEANTLGVTPSHTRSLIPPPRQGLLHKEYFRSDRKCWIKKRSTPDQKKELKQFPGDFSDQKTMVCIRQMLGRPRKRAPKVDASSDSCAAGESNSACESPAQPEHHDDLMAASPSDSAEDDFMAASPSDSTERASIDLND